MGLNTAMIVRNDFLHDIKTDPKFGEKVWSAICCAGSPNPPYHGQSFDVLSSSHADYMQVVAIGGNVMRRIGYGGSWSASDEDVLRSLAHSMGYRLTKIPGRAALGEAGRETKP